MHPEAKSASMYKIVRRYGQHTEDIRPVKQPELSQFTKALAPERLRPREVLAKTSYSIVERVNIKGDRCVIKRSPKAEIDVQSLQALAGRTMRHFFHGTVVSISTPVKVWEEGTEVCELFPFIDGISLYDIVQRNKYAIQGSYLGVIYDCTVRALEEFHELGLLHRDISPGNMLLTQNGDNFLIDVSYATREGCRQIPIQDLLFSAPEQAEGRAVRQSDWYSLAATIFFLAHRLAPDQCDPDTLIDRILEINLGSFYRKNPEPWELIELLLRKDVKERPNRVSDILLQTGTFAVHTDLLGVLDLDSFGFLVLRPSEIVIGSRSVVCEELRRILEEGKCGIEEPNCS